MNNLRLVFAPGVQVALFNVDGTFHALDDACPHAGSSLSAGRIERAQLQRTSRRKMLAVFDLAAGEPDLVSDYRRRLSATLY